MSSSHQPSRTFSLTSNGESTGSWPICQPTLGDKLQELARLSPRHLLAIELLVNQLLETLQDQSNVLF